MLLAVALSVVNKLPRNPSNKIGHSDITSGLFSKQLKQEAFEPPFPLPYAWGSKKVTLAIIF